MDPDQLSLSPVTGHLNIRQNNLNSRLVFEFEVLSKRNLTVCSLFFVFVTISSQFQMKLFSFSHFFQRISICPLGSRTIDVITFRCGPGMIPSAASTAGMMSMVSRIESAC